MPNLVRHRRGNIFANTPALTRSMGYTTRLCFLFSCNCQQIAIKRPLYYILFAVMILFSSLYIYIYDQANNQNRSFPLMKYISSIFCRVLKLFYNLIETFRVISKITVWSKMCMLNWSYESADA